MSEEEELQIEEVEVLTSIYEGDDCYSSETATKHSYKFGEENASRSLLLELEWGDKYPNELPTIGLGSFYNKHLLDEAKEHFVQAVKDECEQYLGMSMTYTIFEYVKENLDTLLEKQPEKIETVCDSVANLKLSKSDTEIPEGGAKVVKKEQLTKAQKRKMWNKGGETEDRGRGWDWIDVVKHLAQSGYKPEDD